MPSHVFTYFQWWSVGTFVLSLFSSRSSLLLHLCLVTLFSCRFFFHFSSNIQESKQHFAAEIHHRKINFLHNRWVPHWSGLKVSRHHNGALALDAQTVFDKTNNSNEKSEHNRQQFLIYGRRWRWLIYSTGMQIWFHGSSDSSKLREHFIPKRLEQACLTFALLTPFQSTPPRFNEKRYIHR